MEQELDRDEFGVIKHLEDGILALEGTEGSANMTDADFMSSMERFAAHAERRGETSFPSLARGCNKVRTHSRRGRSRLER